MNKAETVISEGTLSAKIEPRKIEIDIRRVAVWSLIFTNAFYVAYFLARLI